MLHLMLSLLIFLSNDPLPKDVNGLIFTFDDGPRVGTTDKILDVLKKHRVKAVFCIPTANLYSKKSLALAKRAVKEGHVIYNHSYSHPVFSKISKRRQRWEILHSQKVFKSKLGVSPTLFRPPSCVITAYMRYILRKHKMQMLMWDIDSRDWKRSTTYNQIYTRTIRMWKYRRRKGLKSRVIFHDTNYKTARMLEKIILRVKQGP